jgi:MFS family permease
VEYRQVTAPQWKAFLATFLGWVLDGFDYTILSFLVADVQHSFTVSKALVGALASVTLLFRVIGGIGAGTAADRWGRKGPLMFSILWYSLFAFLSGFSTSYRMLFAFRALQKRDPISLGRLFHRDLISVTLQTSLLMGAFMFSYHSITLCPFRWTDDPAHFTDAPAPMTSSLVLGLPGFPGTAVPGLIA